MKRFLLDQRETLTDTHLQTEWASQQLHIEEEASIVGFFGPIKTQQTIESSHIKPIGKHTDILHLILTVPKTSSREVLLYQRLLSSTMREVIPMTKRHGPDLLIQNTPLSLSYVVHLDTSSIVYMGVFLEFEEHNPLISLKRTETEPNELALKILSLFTEDFHHLVITSDMLDKELLQESKEQSPEEE